MAPFKREHDPKKSPSATDANRYTKGNGSAVSKPPVRRACDCCRQRKVKCDGGDREAGDPCSACTKASVRCAYLQPPKKKGPKSFRCARVLHEVRKLEDSLTEVPTSPLSQERRSASSNWTWTQTQGSPNGLHSSHQAVQPPWSPVFGTPTSGPQEQRFSLFSGQHQQHASAAAHRLKYAPTPYPHSWMSCSGSTSASSDTHNVQSPSNSDLFPQRLPSDNFFPYVRLFFEHMFPIMPVIDRNIYLDPSIYNSSSVLAPDMYCFLCAICATTIVQLNASVPQPPPLDSNKATDDLFADECLRERRTFDYIDSPTSLSVMTSFFLFCYYGNHEKHAKAWHHLQESITFAEFMNMDDEESYAKLDPAEAQWRRRLYWLLFITEHAYAVQRRKHTRLHENVGLPAVFESEDPLLLTGFRTLAKLFSSVDENFVHAWRGSRRQSLCDETWLSAKQKELDGAGLELENIPETQRLDINVTREWLHVLAWQMGVSNGLIWGKNEGGLRLDYPIELATRVVNILTCANAQALDSHGIGMEQKLSDIAACLADVLKCTAGDPTITFLEGQQNLNVLLQRLSIIRGQESRYLKPLMLKMEGLMGDECNNRIYRALGGTTSISYVPVGSVYSSVPGLSPVDPMHMLRTLSISGNLGMPGLDMPHEDQAQRGQNGRIYDEVEMDGIEK